MITIHEKYLIDGKGRRQAVVLPVNEWKEILEALEELDDIRAYDETKKHPSELIPFEQAVQEINKKP